VPCRPILNPMAALRRNGFHEVDRSIDRPHHFGGTEVSNGGFNTDRRGSQQVAPCGADRRGNGRRHARPAVVVDGSSDKQLIREDTRVVRPVLRGHQFGVSGHLLDALSNRCSITG